MGYLGWKTEHAEVLIPGWESAWLDSLPDMFADGIWGVDRMMGGTDHQPISVLVSMLAAANVDRFPYVMSSWVKYQAADSDPGADFFQLWHDFTSSLKTVLRARQDGQLLYRRRPVRCAEVVYNTMMVFGSPLVQFLGRLSVLQRQHGYIEWENLRWAAKLLREGRRQGLLRDDGRWRPVIDFLEDRSRVKGPVVLVHSVEHGFPNCDIAGYQLGERPAGWAPAWAREGKGAADWGKFDAAQQGEYWAEYRSETFGDLLYREQWKLGLKGLRSAWWREISPDTIGETVFSHTVTIPDVLREAGFHRVGGA